MRDKPGERCVRSKVRPTRLALFFLLCPERIVKEKERGRRRRCGIKSNKIRITMWLEKRKKKKARGLMAEARRGNHRRSSREDGVGAKTNPGFFFLFHCIKGEKKVRYLHVSWLCWLGGCAEIRDWERVRRVKWLADGCGCASLLLRSFSSLWHPLLLVIVACPCLYSSWSRERWLVPARWDASPPTCSLRQRENNKNPASRLLVRFF